MSTELTKRLQTAAKGKAPIVAIPIEGHAPVCLPRKRLAAWLKGVEVHSVEVVTPDIETVTYKHPGADKDSTDSYRPLHYSQTYDVPETVEYEGPIQRIVTLSPGTHRLLKIAGRAGNVKTRCTMFVIRRQQAALEIWKWADAERAKNKKILGQGAISAVALKEAKKAAKAKERAAKLLQMEKGGSDELEDAKIEVANILYAARTYGRGPEKKMPPPWEKPEEIEAKKAETIARHGAHHNVSHRVRKQAAVIFWRLKALNTAWFEITKYNRNRRKTTANKFLRVKKSIRVIQIVKDANVLTAKLRSIRPETIPNPRFPDHYGAGFYIDPLSRPGSYKKDHQNHYYEHHDHYDRAGLAKRLRIARETIRVLTPPADEMDVAA